MKVLIRYIGYLILRLLQGTIALLPPRAASGFGRGVGWGLYTCALKRRRVTMRNLGLALPELPEAEHAAVCRRMFSHFGKALTEFLRLPAMSRDELAQRVQYEQRELLDDAVAQGRGVILITAHFGCWELLSAKIAADGYPLHAIAKVTRLGITSRWMADVRQSTGMRVLDSDQVFAAARVLKKNEILGILPDQHNRYGVVVDFFSQSVKAPTGPASLALMTGAVILPCFSFRQPDDSVRVRFYPPIPVVSTGDKDADILAITQQIMAVIEERIRETPDHWLWMHDRWKHVFDDQQITQEPLVTTT